LRTGVFSYTGVEDRVFTVTAWEEYMDDTVYTVTVKRELPQNTLRDLKIWYDKSADGSDVNKDSKCLKGEFTGALTEYTADIFYEARAALVLLRPEDGESVLSYTWNGEAVEPEAGSRTVGAAEYIQVRIPFPEEVWEGEFTVTTARVGMRSRTYTVKLRREQAKLLLEDLTVTTEAPNVEEEKKNWTEARISFNPDNPDRQHYSGEIKDTYTGKEITVRAKLPVSAPEGSRVVYSIDPSSATLSPDGPGSFTSDKTVVVDNDGSRSGGGMKFHFGLSRYTVTVDVFSGDPARFDHNQYTVMITREGVYTIDTGADGEILTEILKGANPVKNALPGTELKLEVTPKLGYTIDTVTIQYDGDDRSSLKITAGESGITSLYAIKPDGSDPLSDASSFGFTQLDGSKKGITGTFRMPAKHITVTATPVAIEKVDNVAYVAEDGWNDAGYSTAVHTADRWGTASKDLQAVINSWTGPTSLGGNFDEIWVKGTVTPKTKADINGYQITSSDPKDLAFVIPSGLKIYGGFEGTEVSRDGHRDPDEWPTVLSGTQDRTTNSYHVVIMADIPDDGGTILDSLTITGGLGADGPDTITVKTYSIDKQSGAGIYLVNASPVLNNVRIQKNTATANGTGNNVGGGGGIYNLAASGGTSSPRLTGTVISGNSVLGNGPGGGIYNRANASSTASPLLDGVTIELNQSSSNGGGMYNYGATDTTVCAPDIKNSRIVRNAAANGAGVCNFSYSAPKFTNVVFEKNTAGATGGGVRNDSNSRPVFDNVRIEANLSGAQGGGIFDSAYTKITNTTIAGNNSNGYGGGIFSTSSKGLELTNVTISGNRASDYAGGIYIARSSVVMSNILIENNYAPYGAGGIWIEHYRPDGGQKAALFIGNGIIRGNRTGGSGGGIDVVYTTPLSGTDHLVYLSLTNVLIAKNTASNGGGISFKNVSAAGTASASGYGIRARLTNVTIADNTTTGEGGGLRTERKNANGFNDIAVSVYNSVIWNNGVNANNNIYDDSGRNTYYNSLVQGLSLTDNSGASTNYNATPPASKNFDPSSWSSNLLDSDYKLGADAGILVNSNSSLFANTDYNFIKDKTALEIIQNGTASPPNMDNLSADADSMVSNMVDRLSNDATAAQGDLHRTVTVNGAVGPNMTVTVTDRNPPPSANTRIQGGTIDVGAYEKK
jgi:parallel beta-helix repeat protein